MANCMYQADERLSGEIQIWPTMDMPEQSLEQVPPGFSSETCIWGLQISFFPHDNKKHCQKFWPINQINQQFHLIWFDLIASFLLQSWSEKTTRNISFWVFPTRNISCGFWPRKPTNQQFHLIASFLYQSWSKKSTRSISLRKICNVMILPIVLFPPSLIIHCVWETFLGQV